MAANDHLTFYFLDLPVLFYYSFNLNPPCLTILISSFLNLIIVDGGLESVPASLYKSTSSPKYFFASAIFSAGFSPSKFALGATNGPVWDSKSLSASSFG